MNFYNKDTTYIIIDDLSFTIISKNLNKTFELPKDIIKNFLIEDKSYLFYILKKEIKNSDLDNFIVISPSDRFIKVNLNIPKINAEDIESMIYYEIEETMPVDMDDYSYVYKAKHLEDKINLDVSLLEKSIIKDYLDIFEKLGKKLKGFYSLEDIIDENTCYFSLNHILFKDQEKSEKLYFDEIYEILKEYDLEYLSLENIIEGKFQEYDESIKEEIKNNFTLLSYKKINYLKDNFRTEKAKFFGNSLFAEVKDLLVNDFPESNFDYEINFNLDQDYNFIKDKKDKKFKIILLVVALLIVNLTFILFLNSNIKKEYERKAELEKTNIAVQKKLSDLDIENIKDENKSLIEEDSIKKENLELKAINKELIDLFLDLENKQKNNLFFNYYELKADSIFLTGFTNSKETLDNFIKGIKYKTEIKDFSRESEVYKFKIEIYTGESNWI